MMYTYVPIFQSKKQDEYDKQPDLFAGNSGLGIIVSLRTRDFQVHYKDGVAEIYLARNMTSDECRELGKALIETANVNDKNRKQWKLSSEPPVPLVDDECPAYDGSGKVGQ